MTQPAPTTQPRPRRGGAGRRGHEALRRRSDDESTGTVIVAGLANLAIAVAKLIGGLISHSSAMMSEAAHSLADTVTEVLLFVALKRGNRPADDRHPFGYGRETYFWAFLAALCTFGVGAGFSIWQGVTTIIEREPEGSPTISYIILAVSFVLEGSSLLKAVRQVRGAAAEREHQLPPVPAAHHRHHGEGGHLRGQRGAGRPGARRAGPVPGADHRRPAVGRRRGDPDRRPADRGRRLPGPGQHLAAHRPVGARRHPAGAQGRAVRRCTRSTACRSCSPP